jgi:hypothetical protein
MRLTVIGSAVVGVVVCAALVVQAHSGRKAAAQPPAIPACGQWTMTSQLHVDYAPLECLLRAETAGESSEARMTFLTTEGDPITYDLLLSQPNSRIALTVDSRDRFGARGQFNYQCGPLQRLPGRNPGTYFYELSGCSGPPAFMPVGSTVDIS